ncbi:outer membrane lipoprotein [Undibacterium oligocarboniphilum]|uniref:Glycine zipper 2TM domain-containing protein n=1 Tax=Undibacterium oligocarboniphilum TaxID=666702 RepID=A0A850QLS3_9BURK|nr:glycine zipper 2TM domain-containing protein [Undibacterium oligocarboniphilum]MBC3869106.1 glycine zipper 2TM domain-containing protein [Undibacterium oligocarboniphilum]NVO77086.1 glycine zipper 2TM domain-containing protein [Undibacterium oligocarboniphilum]
MAETTNKRIHPLVAGAAASVILVSLVGVAAMTGLFPNSNSTPKADSSMVAAPASSVAETDTGIKGNNIRNNVATSNSTSTHEQPARTHSGGSYQAVHQQAHQVCDNCGVVESVRAVEQQPAQGSGLGAVAGAVLGGVLGNQIGGGDGRKLATVAGAVGGGFAGNAIEKRTHTTTVYEVRVRMENGQLRTFTPSSQPGWQSGDRVRVINGSLQSA